MDSQKLKFYGFTNKTATSAAVASAIVTASFGVAEQAYLFRRGKITATRLELGKNFLSGRRRLHIKVFGNVRNLINKHKKNGNNNYQDLIKELKLTDQERGSQSTILESLKEVFERAMKTIH
ncbi:MAG: hypothetical protein ACYCYI_07350 [Saccharofermentanales bacterium]